MKRIILLCIVAISSISFAQVDNANEVFLASRPELSPDGKVLTFSWKGNICSAPVSGGTVTVLSSHPAFEYGSCFSPDGSSIAFTSNRTGVNQVYTMSVDGGVAKQVTFHTAGSAIEQWPNDNELVISGTRDYFWRKGARFFTVSAAGSYNEDLIFDAYGRGARISPDGTKLIFVREGSRWYRQGYQGSQNGQIWLYDIPSGEFELLLGHDGDYDFPAWGTDGEVIYYSASFDNSPKNLWEYNLVTGVKRQLTNFDDGSVISVVSSGDGKVVVFRKLFDFYRISTELNSKAQKIDLLAPAEDMPDTVINKVVSDVSDIAFTSDALEIAFVADRDIWVMDTELIEPILVYRTPKEMEKNLIFSKDNETLYFLADDGINANIYTARRGDPDSYWWQNTEFEVSPITQCQENITRFTISPDGETIAYEIANKGLWLCDIDGSNAREFIKSWSEVDYCWSPKSQYIAYAIADEDIRNNIWITPIDNSREPYNISRNPRDDGSPRWSPDGKYLAWLGRSFNDELDVFYVPMQKETADKTERDLKLEKALKLMKDKRKDKKEKEEEKDTETEPEKVQDDENGTEESVDDDLDNESDDDELDESEQEEETESESGDIIDFDDLYKRVVRLKTTEISEACPMWIADNKLIFNQQKGDSNKSYTIEFPDKLEVEKYSDTPVTWGSTWLKDEKKITLINSGVPALLTKKELKKYSFSVKTEFAKSHWYELGFKIAWRYMRDGFYSGEIIKRTNWDSILDKYLDKAINSPDNNTFGRVVNLMLGELNASHMGFTASNDSSWRSDDKWHETTAHFGARFDYSYEGPGLKVRDILPDTPADSYQSRLYPNDIITHIDGVELQASCDINEILTGEIDRDIALTVIGENDEVREVIIRPVSYPAIQSNLKQLWVNNCKKTVNENSENKLGYVYIPRMMWDEFVTFEKEIFAEGNGKDGMIIDVRGNGGGFTTDHILTVLCQPSHAYVIPRGGSGIGYTSYRKVYNTWDKPIVVLCDQDSFSNAEIFSHAIKTLKRGKLVGVPTAGGVISTGSRNVIGIGNIRMPFIGWYPLETELDMELNGAVPDYTIWQNPGDVPAGNDQQLDKAIEVLLEQVELAEKTDYGMVKPVFLYDDK